MNERTKTVFMWVAYATAFAILQTSYRYLDFVAREQRISLLVPLLEQFTGVYTGVALFWVTMWITRRYPPIGEAKLRNLVVHVLVLTSGSVVHTTSIWGLRLLLFPLFGLGRYDYGAMPARYFMEFPSDVMWYAIVVSVTILYDRQIRASRLEKSLAKAQLQNLRLQLQPHFLFNTLNTISSVMYEDVGVADRMITRLSDLLRLSLEQGDAQEVTLEREIEFLRLYVETMKARFEDRLEVDIEAGEETRGALVPPLVLQPLVENSIRHGADHESSRVRVLVRAHRENGSLCLEVRDHGPGIAGTAEQALHEGVGLSNTAERLDRLYGGARRIDLQNADGGGLLVTLTVPFHVDPHPAGR